MPGNEVEDRVHNFFAQEDLTSGHHRPQAVDGDWQGLENNLWPGNQRPIGLPSSNQKNYNLHQSDIERGQSSHSFQVSHGLNYAQPTHSQSQLPNSNGYMSGHPNLQTRQNEANFLGMDTESNRHNMTSRGVSIYESQGRNGLENNLGSGRSESSESRIGFDFLGQQQTSRQNIGMLHSMPQQQTGFNGMNLLQQQVMLRKMQEFQRQQQEFNQTMHRNPLNNNPSIINGTPVSPIPSASNNNWPSEPSTGNKNWLHRATQGPSNELRFPPEQNQTLSLMGLSPQQIDQSLYGVPVSNTRGTSTHYSQQMEIYNDSSPGDQYRGSSDQVNVHDGSLNSRQGFQENNSFGHPSSQSLARGMYLGNPQLVNSLQRDSPVQELFGPSEIMEEKAVSPVALDPTEEKILFGNGNIWDSFGDSGNVGEGGGSWSALMQSAVAETSSNEKRVQEDWSGPIIQNNEISISPLSGNININKSFEGFSGFQQPVQKNPYEHGDRRQMDSTVRSFPLQKPLAEGIQFYQNNNNNNNSADAINANVPSHVSRQLYGKPIGRDDVESPLQMSQGIHMWKPIPGPQSTGALEQPNFLNNNSGRLNSSTPRAIEGSSPSADNPNFWKHAEHSNTRKENDNNFNKVPLVLESSMNGSGNMHERESRERRENSSESHHSSMSQHNSGQGGSEIRNLLGGTQKAPGQSGQKASGPRKFQYHPMGNLDEDVKSSFGRKTVNDSQSQGQFGKNKAFGQFSKTSTEMEKGQTFGLQQNKKGADDSLSRGTLAGFAPNTSQSSKNILEFPHNLDQSKENSNSDGSIAPLKRSQSFSSHGFGLQLGSLSSSHTSPEMRQNDNTSQANPFPSSPETSDKVFNKNEIGGMAPSNNNAPQFSMLGKLNLASTSGFHFSNNQLQGQQVGGVADRHDPNSLQTKINKKDGKPPNQQNVLSGQTHNNFPPGMFHPGQLNKNIGAYTEGQQANGNFHQPVPSADVAPKPSVSQVKEFAVKNQPDSSPSNSASTDRDFEAFGRSLKPNNIPPQSYSLLNQMRAMKNTDIDPNIRGLKRFKGAETNVGPQMRQSSENYVRVGDPKVLSFSGSVDKNNQSSLITNLRPQNVPATSTSSSRVEYSQISPQMAPSWFEQYGTFKNGQISSMHEASKRSNLKTIEPRLPLGKSSDHLCANNTEEQATAPADSTQAGNILQKQILTPGKVKNLPSAQLMAQNVTEKSLIVGGVKKRKSPARLTSWDEEVTQGSQTPVTISMAEVEWAKAANRRIEKVEEEAEIFEDGPPRRRSKKRLISTTQLMQQLFRPPETKILSADAYLNYEAVACMGSKEALRDSCSLIPCSKNENCAPPDSINALSDKHKTNGPERVGDQRFSEVTEHFIGRAKKLENDFMRLDKRVSVVDLRVDGQELEKMSLINRFAKVHARSQADLASPGPQRYVNAQQIPKILPERVKCLSL